MRPEEAPESSSPIGRRASGRGGNRHRSRKVCAALLLVMPLSAALLTTACTAGSDTLRQGGASAGAIEYRAGLDLSGRLGMGGLSGLYVSDDGSRLTAISDDGRFLSGPLRHDSAGRLESWTVEEIAPLPGLAGGGKRTNDAEALVRQPDGSWLVALERRHRILRYPDGATAPRGEPASIAVPDSIGALPANKGIEALALRPDGVLVALAEARETEDGRHRLYLRKGETWTEKRYRTAPFYAPSDATALPNGDILVLDRGYSLLGGIRSRLVHISSEDLLSQEVVEGVVLSDLQPRVGIDNFEGLSIRRSAEGELLLYLVSDDNFSPLQRTLLVQYALRLSRGD